MEQERAGPGPQRAAFNGSNGQAMPNTFGQLSQEARHDTFSDCTIVEYAKGPTLADGMKKLAQSLEFAKQIAERAEENECLLIGARPARDKAPEGEILPANGAVDLLHRYATGIWAQLVLISAALERARAAHG